jgi:hypothetical protein
VERVESQLARTVDQGGLGQSANHVIGRVPARLYQHLPESQQCTDGYGSRPLLVQLQLRGLTFELLHLLLDKHAGEQLGLIEGAMIPTDELTNTTKEV